MSTKIALLLLALVTLTLGPSGAALGADLQPLVITAAPTAPVLASGNVPVSGGVIVATVMPDLVEGGAAKPVIVVAEAPVDASGNYVLTASPTSGEMVSALARAATNGGWVNLDLTATGTNGKMVIESTSRRFTGGQWISDGSDRAGKVALLRRASAKRSYAVTAATAVDCSAQMSLISTGVTATTNGELHTGDNQNANFYYGQTADSSVEVGLETPAYSGAWSVSGSVHAGNSLSQFASWQVGSQWGHKLRTNMEFKRYYMDYPNNLYPYCPQYDSTKTVESRWVGSTILGADVHSLDNNCGTYPPSKQQRQYKGTSWGRSSYDFTWFDGAFSAFGFSARAKSGSSQYVRANWAVGTNYTYYWYCGSDDFPAYAHRVYAGW
jgi:hypothetical protein